MKSNSQSVWKPGTVTITSPLGVHVGTYDVWGKVIDNNFVVLVNDTSPRDPLWKNRPKAHSYVFGRENGLMGSRTVDNNGYIEEYVGPPGGGVLPDVKHSDFDSEIYNGALGKLNDKVRSSADLSVDSFQAQQVSSMVKSAVRTVAYIRKQAPKKLLGYFFNFKKLDPHVIRKINARVKRRIPSAPLPSGIDLYGDLSVKHMKIAGQKWLEFQYGWKPLASTIYDVAVFLAKEQKDQKIRVVHKRGYDESEDLEIEPLGSGKLDRAYNELCMMECWFKMPTTDAQFLANLTSLNPASIAWELTPFSFVVDWFLDIGGYLRNLETKALFGSTFIQGYCTRVIFTREHSRIYKGYTTLGSHLRTPASAYEGLRVFVRKDRYIMTQYPGPKLPSFKADLGSGRLLNAAALISTLLSKRK